MYRRDFMFACAASALAASLPATPADASPRFYSRARLIEPSGRPLEAHALSANRNFIFHYPFAGTPCFLLNLGKPTKVSAQLKTADEQTYQWPGGVGADHSIVAYSAICAHRLTYPTREISFISYRNEMSPGSKFAHVQQVRIPPRPRSRWACPHLRREPLRRERAGAVLQAAGEVLKAG